MELRKKYTRQLKHSNFIFICESSYRAQSFIVHFYFDFLRFISTPSHLIIDKLYLLTILFILHIGLFFKIKCYILVKYSTGWCSTVQNITPKCNILVHYSAVVQYSKLHYSTAVQHCSISTVLLHFFLTIKFFNEIVPVLVFFSPGRSDHSAEQRSVATEVSEESFKKKTRVLVLFH